MFDFDNTHINDASENKYLLVEIADNFYAFSIMYVKEVLPMIEIFSSGGAENLAGVINLRGESVPVADFNHLIKEETKPITSYQKLVILQFDSSKFAIIVDKLIDIIRTENTNFLPLQPSGGFLWSTIYDNKSIAVVNTMELYKIFAVSQDNEPVPSSQLIRIEEASLPVIKNRTEIINKKDDYVLPDDAFLNEKFIIFRLNNEVYAFNILFTEEIEKIKKTMVSYIPCVPKFIRGIINSDGDYLSLIDIKPFLNMEIEPLKEKNDILILRVNAMRLAVLVDEIIDIDRLSVHQTSNQETSADSFVSGEVPYHGKFINLLDVNKLFSAKNVDIENYEIE